MMESLEAKKVRLLGRWLEHGVGLSEWASKQTATYIINLLDEIEQAYWAEREEADSQTHCTEKYDTSN